MIPSSHINDTKFEDMNNKFTDINDTWFSDINDTKFAGIYDIKFAGIIDTKFADMKIPNLQI